MKTLTTWNGEHRFTCDHEGNRIAVDGDKTAGHGPKALLLSGLAGCSGIDVVDILEKMRVPFSDFSMETEAEVADDHPKVFTSVIIRYRLRTAPENEEKVKKAIELSLEKYCGVAAMLKKNAPVAYELEILQ